MILRLASLTGAALLALAYPAQAAEPALAVIESICAPAKGDRDAVLRLADAAGWTPLAENAMPQEAGLELVRGLHLTQFAVRSINGAAGPMLLLVGRGEGVENESTQCIVAARRPFKGLSKEVKGWLRMPPFQTWGPGGDVYAFADTAAGKRPVKSLSQAEADAAMAAREVVILQVIGGADASMLNYSLAAR